MTEQIAPPRPGVSVSLQRLFVRIGVLPFLLLNFGALLLITYVPEISMVLLHH